jgi:hypothetical protein
MLQRIGKAVPCVLVLLTLILAGCGAENGDDGSPGPDRPSRGYETVNDDGCISDARKMQLVDLRNIGCAQALKTLEAYDAMVDDSCTVTQLRNKTCEVPAQGGAPYGTWKVNQDQDQVGFYWTGADSSNADQAFAATATRRSSCFSEAGSKAANFTKYREEDWSAMTCDEVRQAWKAYEPLLRQCSTADLQDGCEVPARDQAPEAYWEVESWESGLYTWTGQGTTNSLQQFVAELGYPH